MAVSNCEICGNKVTEWSARFDYDVVHCKKCFKSEKAKQFIEEKYSNVCTSSSRSQQPALVDVHKNAFLEVDDNKVDSPQLLNPFSKLCRIIGLMVTIAFVIWGLTYNWSYEESPFESFIGEFGADYRHQEFYTFIFALISLILGWYFRLSIGVFFTASIARIWIFFKLIIKKI